MAMPTKISAAGAAFIEAEEGNIAYVYDDAVYPTRKYKAGEPIKGNLTAGVGHLLSRQIGKGKVNIFPEAHEWIGKSIPKSVRDAWFDQDNNEAEDAVKRLVKRSLTQRQFDTLVSFIFNTGVGAFEGSTLRKRLNRGDDWAKILQEEFPKWRKTTINGKKITSKGLVKRRANEIAFGLGEAVKTKGAVVDEEVTGTQIAEPAAETPTNWVEALGGVGTLVAGAAGFATAEGWMAVAIAAAIVIVVGVGAAVVIKRVWFPA